MKNVLISILATLIISLTLAGCITIHNPPKPEITIVQFDNYIRTEDPVYQNYLKMFGTSATSFIVESISSEDWQNFVYQNCESSEYGFGQVKSKMGDAGAWRAVIKGPDNAQAWVTVDKKSGNGIITEINPQGISDFNRMCAGTVYLDLKK